MNNKYLQPAFTLLEVTIALLIAAICMGISFYVLSTFGIIYSAQQRERQEALSLQNLQYRLSKEALQASRILFEDNTLQFENNDTRITYNFEDQEITRQQADYITDCIAGTLLQLNPQYVEKIDPQLIKTFSFELHTEKGTFPFTIHKQYSAEELMRSNK